MTVKELAAEVERLRLEVAMLRGELAARPVYIPMPQQYYPYNPSYPTITCGTSTGNPARTTATLRSAS